MRFFTEPKPRQLGTVYILGLDWLGEGLLIANGQKWLRNRRLLTPAFHFDILQSYIALKNKAASVLVVLILHICIMLSNLESKAFILLSKYFYLIQVSCIIFFEFIDKYMRGILISLCLIINQLIKINEQNACKYITRMPARLGEFIIGFYVW